MKLVIAHVAEIRAGKETVSKIIARLATEDGYASSWHQFSDPLRETLKRLNEERANGFGITHPGSADAIIEILERIWDIQTTTENLKTLITVIGDNFGYDACPIKIGRTSLQLIARVMKSERGFKDGALSRAIHSRLLKSPTDIVQVDGVRWLSDEALIRSIPGAILVYTTADFEVRAARAKTRRKEGEDKKTIEELRNEETAENEIYITQIGSRADWKILNNYDTLEPLERDVRTFYEAKVKPLLKNLR
jgi:hypothetical protein